MALFSRRESRFNYRGAALSDRGAYFALVNHIPDLARAPTRAELAPKSRTPMTRGTPTDRPCFGMKAENRKRGNRARAEARTRNRYCAIAPSAIRTLSFRADNRR